jgi:hypothetical protein
MTDDTYIKINQLAAAQVADKIRQKIAESHDRSSKLATREHYYGELLPQLRNAINDIIVRGRQQSNVTNNFYEKELTDLLQRVGKAVTDSRDEAMKLYGAAVAYEAVLSDIGESSAFFEAEIQKAKDIQERAAAGELDKPRKVGTRPDKLKDIRNYVESIEDK